MNARSLPRFLTVILPPLIAALQRRIRAWTAPRTAPLPTGLAPNALVNRVFRPDSARAAVVEGSLAGLATGIGAVKAAPQTRGRRSRHPVWTVLGYLVGGIAAAWLFEKLNKAADPLMSAGSGR